MTCKKEFAAAQDDASSKETSPIPTVAHPSVGENIPAGIQPSTDRVKLDTASAADPAPEGMPAEPERYDFKPDSGGKYCNMLISNDGNFVLAGDYDALRAYAAELADQLADCHDADRQKTREINVLTVENRELAARLEVAERDAGRYRALRMDEYHRLLRGLPLGHTADGDSVYRAYDAHSDSLPKCPRAAKEK